MYKSFQNLPIIIDNFVKNFTSIVRLLYDLVKKLVLATLNLDKIRIEVNALNYVIKEVLSMEYENKCWRLVTYLSKSLNKIERNYEIHDKKMLVVIRGMENQRYLLEDAKFKFKIWTDHKNLEYFIKVQKLNCKQVR